MLLQGCLVLPIARISLLCGMLQLLANLSTDRAPKLESLPPCCLETPPKIPVLPTAAIALLSPLGDELR